MITNIEEVGYHGCLVMLLLKMREVSMRQIVEGLLLMLVGFVVMEKFKYFGDIMREVIYYYYYY